ncbi:MAG: ring-hydroxylating oxygenase subunit alpha [Rhodospirillaceae bacterium]|nr:ring-hydroxylating oxygenase subunit alpha [Rhodospirillaceae bacterium]
MNMHPELGYFDEGLDLTQPELYAAASKPFGRARILPPAAFRSKIFADLEDEKVWTRTWVCVGLQQQIPNPGDLLPFTVGTHGVHVERGRDGGLIGRFNKAQHGGCRAIPAQCQTGAKTRCSFTSCGYSRDREAIDSSEAGEGSQLGGQYLGDRPERLLPVKVDSWGPFVFVNLDNQSEPLGTELKGMAKQAGKLFDGDLPLAAQERREHRCNWKLTGRAFLENIALPFADMKATKTNRSGAAGTPCYASRSIALSPGNEAHLYWLFPNLLLVLMPEYVVAVILQPTATAMTLERINILADAAAGDAEELAETWADILDASAAHGKARQQEFKDAAKRLPVEDSASGYEFQKFLVACILKEHEYFWSAPLFAQPGR